MEELFRVLVADDERIIREGITGYVPWEKLGLSLAGCAKNGDEALELLRREPVDIVITDIRMPGLNGLEMAERLEQAARPPYVILISGYSDFAYAKKAVQLKCVVDYVLKPLELEQLEAVLLRTRALLNERDASVVVPSAPRTEGAVRLGSRMVRMNAELIRLISAGDDGAFEQMERIICFWNENYVGGEIRVRQCCELLLSMEGLLAGHGLCMGQVSGVQQPVEHVKLMTPEEIDIFMEKTVRACTGAVVCGGTQGHSALIKSAVEEIVNSYTRMDFSLQVLSGTLQVSPNYLSARFKEETGMGFVRYLNEKRMERAKGLLGDVSRKVYEVAYMCGIEDVRYFTRLFKEYVGVTPKEYRDKLH